MAVEIDGSIALFPLLLDDKYAGDELPLIFPLEDSCFQPPWSSDVLFNATCRQMPELQYSCS
jgi:hypothetical protein